MAGYKLWAADEVLTAADLNGYLMTQAVPRFADASTRSGAILSPGVGQITYRTDGAIYEQWNGTAWVGLNAAYAGGVKIHTGAATPTADANATLNLWFY